VNENGFEPKIVAFTCNWCSYAAADLAGTSRIHYPPNVRTVRVMCSGMVDPIFVLRALETGFDGVLIAGCHFGDCHYVSGNVKAQDRVESLRKLLYTLGLEEERLRLEWISAAEGGIFAETIEKYVVRLKELGPSPFRKEPAA
jgi:F420-non-reducing hydrogenase iron-sulfur subunit